MCSVPRVPKCGQLVVRNLFWLHSKFFFYFYLLFIDEFNRIRTENRVETKCCRLLLLLLLLLLLFFVIVVVVVVAVYCNERETFSTRDVAVLFVSYFVVVIAFLSMLLFC